MDESTLARLEADFSRLSREEQRCLLERLSRRIRTSASRQERDIQKQLAAMAKDADIQREIHAIEAEFGPAETDGLDSD